MKAQKSATRHDITFFSGQRCLRKDGRLELDKHWKIEKTLEMGEVKNDGVYRSGWGDGNK